MQRARTNVINVAAIILGVLVVILGLWVASRRLGNGAFSALAGGVYAQPVQVMGIGYLVPKNDIIEAGRGEDDAPTLVNPTFVGNGAGGFFADDLHGIGLVIDGDARFYPHQIMNWHEVVDDMVGGEHVAVVHSTFCGSDAVFALRDGMSLRNSGKVYNNCTLLEDGEGNLWDAVTGQQVVGKNAGDVLERVPATTMTFKEWKTRQPNGKVLSENTSHERLYKRHPFGSYDTSGALYFPLNATHCIMNDAGGEACNPPMKMPVTAVLLDGQALGFAQVYVQGAGVLNASVGERRAVAFFDYRNSRVQVFVAVVDGKTLSFSGSNGRYVDKETGTEWNADGVAVSGQLAGKNLQALPSMRMFAFAFAAHYPQGIWPGRPEVASKDTTVQEGETIEVPATIGQ